MTRTTRNFLLAGFLLLALGMAGGVAWLLREPDARPEHEVYTPPPPSAPATANLDAKDDGANRGVEKLAVEPKRAHSESTVVFPLIVELVLTRSDFAPKADGVAPLGSAATARLKGSIHGPDGEGVRAEIRFVGGANVGRVLYADRQGGFGATDLYPGLSVVQVSGPGIVGSLRETLLRQDRDQWLNIGYGRPSTIYGQVFNRDGAPLAGAKVTLDGQEAFTDDSGVFLFTRVASGTTLVFVEKPGYVTYREPLTVAAASTIEKGRLKYTLQPGARLAVDIAESINNGVQAELYLLPAGAEGQRKFPWYKINPVKIYPGGATTIEDLPPGTVELRLYHSGASADPPVVHVELEAGLTAHQTLHLKPAPVITGVVRENGKPVERAKVRLEVPDRVHGMMATFGTSDFLYLEREVFPNLPPTVQETTTNSLGEFQLTASEEISRERYVVATSPDGKSTGGVVLKSSVQRVDIDISPTSSGEGELVIQMDKRYQPLPVNVIVNNQPDSFDLSPDQDLHIPNLPSGTWKINVRWDTDTILNDVAIELKKETTLSITLPQGAIIGQDESVRKRLKRN